MTDRITINNITINIIPVYELGYQTGYRVYAEGAESRFYSKNNPNFYGPNGFDRNRAINQIAHRYYDEELSSFNIRDF